MGQIMDAARHKIMYFAADPDSDQDFDNIANLYATPVSAFRGFNMESSSGTTQIYLYFEPQRMQGLDTTNDANAYDRVLLNISTNYLLTFKTFKNESNKQILLFHGTN